MTFSILAWNIWFYNQIEGKARANRLMNELERLVNQHGPDFIALNEVVQPAGIGPAAVIEQLRNLGYSYSHCANPAQIDNSWLCGAGICSRLKINQKKNIVISKDGLSAKWGYPGYNKEAVDIRVELPGYPGLKIIVAHPLPTIDSPKDHRAAINKLSELMHSDTYEKNTILVGDMNEWRLIPGALRTKVSDVMHSRTGSVLNPTWRYNARRFTPLRLNLDYVYWSKQSDFSLKNFEVLSSNASDHSPLLATFEYSS